VTVPTGSTPQDTPRDNPSGNTPPFVERREVAPARPRARDAAGERAKAVGGGVLLLGLAVLFLTDWWWPGIMLVLGIAFAAERLMDGRLRAAIGVAATFTAIPLAISLSQSKDVPWTWLVALVLGGLGIAGILRGVANRA